VSVQNCPEVAAPERGKAWGGGWKQKTQEGKGKGKVIPVL